MSRIKTYIHDKPFQLEVGVTLSSLEIVYNTYGTLNKEKNNVIWVCHALTANSDVFDWWKGLFGEKDFFNPGEHFIVCANNLGSCYGTTGPLTHNNDFNGALYSYFPNITIRDMVNAHELLRQHLGIEKIHTVIGGSQGGQQAAEWNILKPELFSNLVLVATNAQHSPWGIAFNESQRLAIKADRTYYSNNPEGGQKGLAAARSIALLSYRNYNTYGETQKENSVEKTDDYNSSSYQRYQGEKLVKRFNAYSYVALSKAMDSHNVGRGRESVEKALANIKAKTLVIGVSSDLLFPLSEQRFLVNNIPTSFYATIDSFYGHDGFLIETEKLTAELKKFYEQTGDELVKNKKAISL
ncbi:MAG TPA: homoserine O-acetyltransferase [Bacteroidia bacterium]|jgi:homoserine O-acetyltransferase|nr:homoserine O-acetyltransferase [Bacteroidia bacterium]